MKYQKIGEVLILNKDDKKLAEKLLKEIPNTKTIMVRTGSIEGEYRKPKLKKLAGNGTETVHKEHGCLFKLDTSRIMWSMGNHKERIRLVKLIKPGETIVDMFAGVGYFSIPLAVHSKASKIYSIEINPLSFSYLKENIKLNRVKNVEPILGDCSKVKIPQKTDRGLMGLLPSSKKYLSTVLKLIKSGGIIHYHGIDGEKPNNLENDLKEIYKCQILKKTKVKSWGPRRYHWVLDVKIEKNT